MGVIKQIGAVDVRLSLLGSSGRWCEHTSEWSNLRGRKLSYKSFAPSAPGVFNSLALFSLLQVQGQEKVLQQRTTDACSGRETPRWARTTDTHSVCCALCGYAQVWQAESKYILSLVSLRGKTYCERNHKYSLRKPRTSWALSHTQVPKLGPTERNT